MALVLDKGLSDSKLLAPAALSPLRPTDAHGKERVDEVKLHYYQDFDLPTEILVSLPTYLEHVTLLFLEACNIRDVRVLRAIVDRYVAPTFTVHKSETFRSLSRESYVKGKVAFWAENPTFRLHPRNTTAFIEDDKEHALVFSTNSIIGTVVSRPELTREEVTVNHFKRLRNGDWICTKFESLRGPGHWTFEVGHVN